MLPFSRHVLLIVGSRSSLRDKFLFYKVLSYIFLYSLCRKCASVKIRGSERVSFSSVPFSIKYFNNFKGRYWLVLFGHDIQISQVEPLQLNIVNSRSVSSWSLNLLASFFKSSNWIFFKFFVISFGVISLFSPPEYQILFPGWILSQANLKNRFFSYCFLFSFFIIFYFIRGNSFKVCPNVLSHSLQYIRLKMYKSIQIVSSGSMGYVKSHKPHRKIL